MNYKDIKTKQELENFIKSINIDDKYLNQNPYKTLRNKQDKIKKLILHTTGGRDVGGVQIGIGLRKDVSFHYIVLQQQDKIYRLISEDNIAYHAGGNDLINGFPNTWNYGTQANGMWNMNANSIGIEIVNLNGQDIVNQNQLNNTVGLLLQLLIDYNLEPSDILAHFEIASFKFDPYLNFTKGVPTSGIKNQEEQIKEMNEFRSELTRLYNIYYGIVETKKYDNITGYEIFNDLDDNYETKRLIEIGLYRFVQDIKEKKLKIRK